MGDSVGGVLETAVIGMPAGIGEPFFHSIESRLSALLYSVPAVKGVAFGDGFGFAELYGSEANDPVLHEKRKGQNPHQSKRRHKRRYFKRYADPFSDGGKAHAFYLSGTATVNVLKKEDAVLQIRGRHDPAIIHRARVVVDSVTAIALTDLFCERYGYLWTADSDLGE